MKIKSIKNIKIKTKLLLLGAVSIFGLVLIGTESVMTARELNMASTEISQSWVPAIIIAEELNTAISHYRIKEYNHVVSNDNEIMDRLEQEMAQVRLEIDQAFDQYAVYLVDEEDMGLMKSARTYWDEYLEYSDRLLRVSRSNGTEEALEMIIGESKTLFDKASDLFLRMAEYNRLGAEQASIQGDQLYENLSRSRILIIALIAAMISLLVAYIIRAIDKPVNDIVEGARRISNGDLDVFLSYQSDDEIGILTESVNQLIERLKRIIDDEKYLFQEIGNENFEVKSSCEQAYRGDFAPILYSLSSLMSRLDVAKRRQQEKKAMEAAKSDNKSANDKDSKEN